VLATSTSPLSTVVLVLRRLVTRRAGRLINLAAVYRPPLSSSYGVWSLGVLAASSTSPLSMLAATSTSPLSTVVLVQRRLGRSVLYVLSSPTFWTNYCYF